MGLLRIVTVVVLAALAGGCATIINDPVNVPLRGNVGAALAASADDPENVTFSDNVLVALAFSGGGTRAAAFSFGVLTEMDKARLASRGGKRAAAGPAGFRLRSFGRIGDGGLLRPEEARGP
jgi:NTE family protein